MRTSRRAGYSPIYFFFRFVVRFLAAFFLVDFPAAFFFAAFFLVDFLAALRLVAFFLVDFLAVAFFADFFFVAITFWLLWNDARDLNGLSFRALEIERRTCFVLISFAADDKSKTVVRHSILSACAH